MRALLALCTVAAVAGLLAGCPGSSKPASTNPEPQASGDDAATRYAHVLVGGVRVVRNGKVVEGVTPGRPIRAEH